MAQQLGVLDLHALYHSHIIDSTDTIKRAIRKTCGKVAKQNIIVVTCNNVGGGRSFAFVQKLHYRV